MQKILKTKPIKKIKKVKLKPIKSIITQLYNLASQICRIQHNDSCAYCNTKSKTINKNGKPTRIEAHHLIPRDSQNHNLKFEPMNLIALCTLHHKFSRDCSPHKNPIIFFQWFQQKYPDKYNYLVNQNPNQIQINLKSRTELESLKQKLQKQLELLIESKSELKSEPNQKQN